MGAERRQLTILFCDIVDSLSFVTELDPEDTRDILLEYQTICGSVVKKYDGYIARYVGDGLLVYFGYPQADETDALRAIHAALEIRKTFEKRNSVISEFEKEIHIRIGVDTGLVVIGEIGDNQHRSDTLAVGESPNIAARLQQYGQAGDIVISHSTYQMVANSFSIEATGVLNLKGIKTDVPAYKVLGKSSVVRHLGFNFPIAVPGVVGRHRELEILKEKWILATNGECQTVMISGESGVGKSALIFEFEKLVAAHQKHTVVFHSSKLHSNTPFAPVINWLTELISPPFQHQQTNAITLLNRFITNRAPHLLIHTNQIANLVDIKENRQTFTTPTDARSLVFDLTVSVLLSYASERSLLLILEDGQWADPSTLELMDHIQLKLQASPTLIALTSRCSENPPIKQCGEVIRLGKLSNNYVKKLVLRVFQEAIINRDVVDQIVEKSNGLPLFAEEITKTVVATQNTNQSHTTIPGTLRDSLASQLDRLGKYKWIVQLASVVGRKMDAELLRAVVKTIDVGSAKDFDLVVEELEDQRIFIRSENGEIGFRHILLQEAAYESLIREVRRKYHEAIAEVLVTQPGHSPVEMAHHLREAMEYARSIDYMIVSAQSSIKKGATLEAFRTIDKALATSKYTSYTDAEKQTPLLYVTMGAASMISNGFGALRTGAIYRNAYRLSGNRANLDAEIQSLWGLARYYTISRKLALGLKYAEKAKALAQTLSHPMYLMEADLMVGVANLWLGNFQLALDHYNRALDVDWDEKQHSLSMLAGEHPMVTCLSRMAFPLWALGHSDNAVECSERAITLAANTNHVLSSIRALAFSGWVRQFRGEIDIVLEISREVVRLSDEHNYPFWKNCGGMQLGWALSESGQTEAGIVQLESSLNASKRTGAVGRTYHRVLLAEQFLKTNSICKANIAITDAFDSAKKSGDGFWLAELYRVYGEICCQQNKSEEGEKYFNKALRLAEKQNAIFFQIRAMNSIARITASAAKKTAVIKQSQSLKSLLADLKINEPHIRKKTLQTNR